jgi:glycosyltransferase involved in cell wall biosynthesis
MRILIVTVQVPFVRGGAEVLAEGLRNALVAAGHQTETVAIPFKWYPPERILDHMLACRLFDLSESAGNRLDRVIGLKFPAYLIPHPNKVLWLVHQHRSAYDLWSSPLGDLVQFPHGAQVRDAIRNADQQFIPQAKAVYTIAENVSHRLRVFNGIDSTPLYHPPQNAEKFYTATPEEYLYFPSRLWPTKRQALVLEALAHTRQPVTVRFAGTADNPAYGDELHYKAKELKVHQRVQWLGSVSEEEKRSQYARCLGVLFPPHDEDYGYITLEAMLAAKPVVTCSDSGGPLEFVLNEKTGLIVEPTPEALAAAMDKLWQDRDRARAWGQAGGERYEALNISWQTVVQRLAA